ncbi:hypothetical protein K488DRAFT_74611, partial [Vararia minispora EC-137]
MLHTKNARADYRKRAVQKASAARARKALASAQAKKQTELSPESAPPVPDYELPTNANFVRTLIWHPGTTLFPNFPHLLTQAVSAWLHWTPPTKQACHGKLPLAQTSLDLTGSLQAPVKNSCTGGHGAVYEGMCFSHMGQPSGFSHLVPPLSQIWELAYKRPCLANAASATVTTPSHIVKPEELSSHMPIPVQCLIVRVHTTPDGLRMVLGLSLEAPNGVGLVTADRVRLPVVRSSRTGIWPPSISGRVARGRTAALPLNRLHASPSHICRAATFPRLPFDSGSLSTVLLEIRTVFYVMPGLYTPGVDGMTTPGVFDSVVLSIFAASKCEESSFPPSPPRDSRKDRFLPIRSLPSTQPEALHLKHALPPLGPFLKFPPSCTRTRPPLPATSRGLVSTTISDYATCKLPGRKPIHNLEGCEKWHDVGYKPDGVLIVAKHICKDLKTGIFDVQWHARRQGG